MALAVVPPLPAIADEAPMDVVPAPRAGAEELTRRGARRAAASRPRARVRPRYRLTRRGRVVASVLVMALVLLVAALAWIAGAARADAAGSGAPPGAVYHNLASVIVRPGQSLWAIAAQAEPGADPRSVIQQIVDLNALGGTSIQPGQHLWVPRG